MFNGKNLLSNAGKLAIVCLAVVTMITFFVQGAKADYPNFYGGNAHPDFTWAAQDYVNYCHSHGMKYVRIDTWGYDTTTVTKIASLQQGINAIDSSIKILPCIAGWPSSSSVSGPGSAFPNESLSPQQNYDNAYAGARYVAQTLGGVGITTFECGNEYTAVDGVDWHKGYHGDSVGDFACGTHPNYWPAMVMTFDGMINGIHSVNSTYRCGVDFCVNQFKASDMLWNGLQPRNSSDFDTATVPALYPVRWDITMWHNYQPDGDLFNQNDNQVQNFNTIAYIAQAYGKPIMLTEWNASGNDATRAAWTSDLMPKYFYNRLQYKIEAVFFYLMGVDSNFGMDPFPQQTAAFTNFTANHPIVTGGNIANGNHTLTSQNAPGYCLDANNWGTANGTKVQLWTANGTGTQSWTFTNMGNNTYKIQPSYAYGMALDVNGASSANGATVQLWQDNNGTAQRWTATAVNGGFTFTPLCATGSRLDSGGGAGANGAQAQIWASLNNPNQIWTVN